MNIFGEKDVNMFVQLNYSATGVLHANEYVSSLADLGNINAVLPASERNKQI